MNDALVNCHKMKRMTVKLALNTKVARSAQCAMVKTTLETKTMNDSKKPRTPWEQWQVALARECAVQFASTLTAEEKGLGEKYNYLAYAEQDPPWEPHPWVLVAIAQAHALGKLAGEAEGRKTGDFIAEQQAEQYKGEMTGAVRATIATMMEALDEGGPGIPYVTLDPTKLATIYDRVTLDFHQEEDGRFTYRMFRGANAPVPSIAPLVPVKLDDAEARANTQRNREARDDAQRRYNELQPMIQAVQKEHPLWNFKRVREEAKTRVTNKLGISNDGGTLRVIKAD